MARYSFEIFRVYSGLLAFKVLNIDNNYLTHCILAKFAFSTLCDLFSFLKGISQNDFSKRKIKNDFLKSL